MSRDVLPAAFYRAEADYLTPPEEDDCTCEYSVEWCAIHAEDDDWDEHEWEMNQDAKEAREGL